MPDGFIQRAFENPPTSFATYGVIVSPTGKFVFLAGANASSKRLWMWDDGDQIYRSITPPPETPNSGMFSDDEAYFVCVESSGSGQMIAWSVDPTTGAFTELGRRSGANFGRPVVFLPPNIIISVGSGANRFISVNTIGGGVITEQHVTSASFAPTSSSWSVPSPVANCFYRVAVTGTVQLYEINLTTYIPTLKASITNAFAIGNVNSVALNKDRTILALGVTGSGAGAAPWVRLVKYDIATNTFTAVPSGGTADENYPRDDLALVAKGTTNFISDDGVLVTVSTDSAASNRGVIMTGDAVEFQEFDLGLLPVTLGPTGNLSQPARTSHSSQDNKVSAFAYATAPYVDILQQTEPSASWDAVGLMGDAALEFEVDTNAAFDALGIMGDAAIEVGVNTNATFTEMGFLGIASLTAGIDASGPDTQLVFLRPAYMLLDGVDLEYTTEFAGLSAFIAELGLMGDADIRLGVGTYLEFDQVGLMGAADLETTYIAVTAEIADVGLMGVAAISADVQTGVRIQAQGIMGTATFNVNSPYGAFFDAVGLMGDAGIIAYDPQEANLSSVAPMGTAEILTFGSQVILVDAIGLMGQADITMLWVEAFLTDVGLMGDAEILTLRTAELGNIDAVGLLGNAAIELEEVLPIDATLTARGIMGTAEILSSVPDHMNLSAVGLMGTATITMLPGELARFEPIGIMGQAEFLNIPGTRGDIRALGLMGRADLTVEVSSIARINAVGLMGRSDIETRRRVRRKTFFIIKPF